MGLTKLGLSFIKPLTRKAVCANERVLKPIFLKFKPENLSYFANSKLNYGGGAIYSNYSNRAINNECLDFISSKSHSLPHSNLSQRDLYLKVKNKLQEMIKIRDSKYGSTLNTPLRNATLEERSVINIIQCEEGAYNSLNDKLKLGKPLTKEEKILFKRIKDAMSPLKEDKILWRSISEYPELREEVSQGILRFPHITSCTNHYDSKFFRMWSQLEPVYDESSGELSKILEPLMLKIKVPKGTKVLQCNIENARYCKEVCLAPGKAKIIGLDKNAGVIEVEYLPNSLDKSV